MQECYLFVYMGKYYQHVFKHSNLKKIAYNLVLRSVSGLDVNYAYSWAEPQQVKDFFQGKGAGKIYANYSKHSVEGEK